MAEKPFSGPIFNEIKDVLPDEVAIGQGFEVYVITDASGDISDEAHESAVAGMIQAGARPMTSLQYLLELQRDWARGETYNETVATSIAHGGGYGLGVMYAKRILEIS